ncbi:hypothetical protein ACFLTZ_01935 [Chloroflexota bacterium]
MKVARYARVSTNKQAEKYGIPSQSQAWRRRCLERGILLSLARTTNPEK